MNIGEPYRMTVAYSRGWVVMLDREEGQRWLVRRARIAHDAPVSVDHETLGYVEESASSGPAELLAFALELADNKTGAAQ